MFIHKLSAKNFKAIKEAELDFAKINLITGDNGNGKSSLIESLRYLTTDTLNSKLSEYVRWGCNDFELYMHFSHTGLPKAELLIQYEKATKKILKLGDEQFLNTEATRKMAEIINPVLTLYSALALQREDAAILFETSARRLEKLKAIFGIDRITEVVEQMKEEIDLLVSKSTAMSLSIEEKSRREFHFLDLPNVDEDEFVRLKNDLEKMKEKKIAYLKALDQFLAESRKYEEQKQKTKRLNEVTELLLKVREENSKLKLVRIPAFSLADLDSAKKETKALEAAFDHYNKSALAYKKVLLERQSKEKKLEELQSAISSKLCPTCGQTFTDSSHLDSHILLLKEELISYADLKAPEAPKYSLDEMRLREAKLQAEYEIWLKKKTDNDKTAFIKQSLQQKEEALIAEESSLKEEIALIKISSEPKKPEFDEATFDRLIKAVEAMKALLSEKEKIEAHNKAIEEQKKKNAAEIKELEHELEGLRFQETLLKETRKILEKDFSSHVIENGSKFLQEEMNAFFQKCYGRFQVKLVQDKKSVEFAYTEDNVNFSTVNMTGGYEASLLATSFRVALCKLQNLGIYVCDEIDSYASSDKAIRLFQNLLDQNWNQLFIISHNEEVKEWIGGLENAKIFDIVDGTVS